MVYLVLETVVNPVRIFSVGERMDRDIQTFEMIK